MKPFLASLALSLSLTVLHADEAPSLKAAEAAAIAQGDLESRGLDATVYIAELVFKKAGPFGGDAYWEVLWSAPFDAQTEGRKEFGLRIALDGSYKRSVR